jgi:dienelactone hydrolase
MRRHSGIVGLAAAVLVVLPLLASGCSSDPGSSTAATTTTVDPRAGRPHTVATTAMTFVDTSRPTPEGAGGPAESSRTIVVWLTLPADLDGPAPMIVLSHGMAGHPRKFQELTRAWAEAGYAVAAPTFPRSNADVPNSFTNLYDVVNQPGDVVFVLDQLLALSADSSSPIAGRLDPERIGAAGHSAGGFTTYRVAVDHESRDPRFRAAVVMSAAGNTLSDAALVKAGGLPVMLLHGDKDPLIDPTSVVATYDALSPPRYLVTLHGAGHAGEFEDPGGFEPKVPGQDEIIRLTTIAFWDRYLLGVESARQELVDAAGSNTLVTFRQDGGS